VAHGLDKDEGCQYLWHTGVRCHGKVVLRVAGPHLLMVTVGETKPVVVSHCVGEIDIRYCERHIPPILRRAVEDAIGSLKLTHGRAHWTVG